MLVPAKVHRAKERKMSVEFLQNRLRDRRSRQVVFVAHCLLNENTRYLGGACRSAPALDTVKLYAAHGCGVVQMPCPEQLAWGGVSKRWLLRIYGVHATWLYRWRRLLLPLMLLRINLIYARLARQIVDCIADYRSTGYCVETVVGVDGSPTCGVTRTLDIRKAFDMLAHIEVESVSVGQMNSLIRQCALPGRGLFTSHLKRELKKRQLDIPFHAHDLLAEIACETAPACGGGGK